MGDRVEVRFTIGRDTDWYPGSVVKVTPTACEVKFDDDDSVWYIKRYGKQGRDDIRMAAPPDYAPPQDEPEDLRNINLDIVYQSPRRSRRISAQ